MWCSYALVKSFNYLLLSTAYCWGVYCAHRPTILIRKSTEKAVKSEQIWMLSIVFDYNVNILGCNFDFCLKSATIIRLYHIEKRNIWFAINLIYHRKIKSGTYSERKFIQFGKSAFYETQLTRMLLVLHAVSGFPLHPYLLPSLLSWLSICQVE